MAPAEQELQIRGMEAVVVERIMLVVVVVGHGAVVLQEVGVRELLF